MSVCVCVVCVCEREGVCVWGGGGDLFPLFRIHLFYVVWREGVRVCEGVCGCVFER